MKTFAPILLLIGFMGCDKEPSTKLMMNGSGSWNAISIGKIDSIQVWQHGNPTNIKIKQVKGECSCRKHLQVRVEGDDQKMYLD